MSLHFDNSDDNVDLGLGEGLTLSDVKDALAISKTGIWKLEAETGKHTRFYGDSLMNKLIGVSDDTSPEERFDYFMSRVYEEDMPLFMTYYENLKKEQSEIIYRYNHETLGLIYVRCGGKRDHTVTGKACYRGFHQNVNETAVIEQVQQRQLVESAELYRKMASKLMESLTTSAMYIDLQERDYKWLSIHDKRLDGVEGYVNLGKVFSSLMPEEYGKQFLEKASFHNLKKVLADRDEYSFSVYVYGEEGELRRITMTYYVVDESRRYLLAVSQDTTKDYHREKELAAALLAAEDANKAKTIFLSNMSHDIRTPMNAIIGFKNLAQKYVDDKERCLEYLKKIGTSSEHLLSLINDVLDMSRIESGKMNIVNDYASLTKIMQDLDTIFTTGALEKGISMKVEQNITHDVVLCDELRVNQVLLNCISNAIKFTGRGGNVYVGVEEIPSDNPGVGNYRFTIKDTGMGMSQKFIKTIFEPFTREEEGAARFIAGTGLGMSICKNIVDMMGGTIAVESEQGVGSCFTIILSMPYSDEVVLKNSEECGEKEFTLKGKRVLLVEDNELNREIAMEILDDTEAVADQAENGKIALDMVADSPEGYYDLILMDVQMPVMNGYEAAAAIRKLNRQDVRQMVIIAMTANAFAEDRQNALDAGMDDHVAKPIDVDILIETLKKHME